MQMKKLPWGIVVAVLGILSLIGAGNNPQGPLASIVVGLILIIGGGALAFFGWRTRSQRKLVVERAFKTLRESNVIRPHDLAVATGLSEIEVRQHVADAQRAGLIPVNAQIS
jgi:hypothetical protein